MAEGTAYTSDLNLPTLVSGNPFPFTFKVKAGSTLIPISSISSLVAVFTPATGDPVFKTLADVTYDDDTSTVGAMKLTAAETEPWNGMDVTFEMRIVDAEGDPWTPYLDCVISFATNQISAAVAAEHP